MCCTLVNSVYVKVGSRWWIDVAFPNSFRSRSFYFCQHGWNLRFLYGSLSLFKRRMRRQKVFTQRRKTSSWETTKTQRVSPWTHTRTSESVFKKQTPEEHAENYACKLFIKERKSIIGSNGKKPEKKNMRWRTETDVQWHSWDFQFIWEAPETYWQLRKCYRNSCLEKLCWHSSFLIFLLI